MKKTFYSNGKLLITGEYLVLNGAKAFALPTKFGQHLTIEAGENKEINWTSFDYDSQIWFHEKISFSEIIQNEHTENAPIKNTLIEILHESYLLNPDFTNQSEGYTITTMLTFPKKWGLGTSSTLINNIAQWLNIDAFKLLKNSFGGSGYDIACAQNNAPIIYQLVNEIPNVTSNPFHPEFTKNLYFVYLNKKQSSKTAIASYYKKQNQLEKTIPEVNRITELITTLPSQSDFEVLLEKHEIIMSHVLEIQTVKESLFPDFNGVIKSLGAWGGDFVLVISEENPSSYFKAKGYETLIPYQDMIL
jgi:mevalonate kinase